MISFTKERRWFEDAELKKFLIEKSDNGSLFHRPRFLSYHATSKFLNITPVQFKFYKNNNLIGYINGAFYKTGNDKCFVSPFASSYGGFVLDDLTFGVIEEIINILIEELKKDCQIIKIGTTPNFLSKSNKSSYLDYLLLSKGFITCKADIIMIHELNNEDFLVKHIDRKTFTELKQALFKQPLRLEVINGVDEQAYNLLNESQNRLGSKPTHTYEELIRIEELIEGTVKTFKSFVGDIFLSGIIAFHINNQVLNTFYIFDNIQGRSFKANHFLYYHLLVNAFKMGYKYVDFGASTFGWIPNYHLIAFKEKFVTKPFLRNTYEKYV